MDETHSRYRHGMSGSRPYAIWNGIHTRCYNEKSPSYGRYGGSGIRMCERWRKDFSNFWEDMKDTYFDGAQIDRIDNSKGYCKSNCRWVTIKEQARNKGSVTLYKYGDELLTSFEIDKKLKLKPGTVRARILYYKWPVEKAITTAKKRYVCPGVSYSVQRRKWCAYVKKNGKRHDLGRFETKREAVSARKLFLLTSPFPSART